MTPSSAPGWLQHPLLRGVSRIIRTVALKCTRGSDLRRWCDDASLHDGWAERTALLAEWVPPGSRVLDIGAGRRALRALLPPGCTYIPADLVHRGSDTFTCDLNASVLPPFPDHDVAVLSGVLEYVHDVPRLIAHLGRASGHVVASYASVRHGDGVLARRRHGWVNDYGEEQLRRLFDECGFRCRMRRQWREQDLFLFQHATDRN